MNKLLPDFGAMLKKYSLSSDSVKTLGAALGLVLLACLIIFFVPVLIVHMWNNFFHAILHLPTMYYDNAVALVFWLIVVVAAVVLVKDVGGEKK